MSRIASAQFDVPPLKVLKPIRLPIRVDRRHGWIADCARGREDDAGGHDDVTSNIGRAVSNFTVDQTTKLS